MHQPTTELNSRKVSAEAVVSVRRFSSRRRWFLGGAYLLYLTVLGYGGIKLFFLLNYDVPLTEATTEATIWQYYYPEMWRSGVVQADATSDSGRMRVLLLGGSVLEQVAERFEVKLSRRTNKRLQMFNLARPAHTSRDSFLKHDRVADKHFDLIVIYHGINDARMNCCPPQQFRDDYSHCRWYASMQKRMAAGKLNFSEIAYDKTSALVRIGRPDEQLLEYGRAIKTPPAFEHNLARVIETARRKRQTVAIATFAYYIPEDYTQERFLAGQLDYGKGPTSLPAEVWGKPQHVAAAIDAHNAVLRKLARRYDNVLLIDQARRLSASGRNFSDPCHLTDEGCAAFVGNLMDDITDVLPQNDHSR